MERAIRTLAFAGIGPTGPSAQGLNNGDGMDTMHTPAHGTGDGDSGSHGGSGQQ